MVGTVMPIVIIAILGIALVLYARKRNSDEIRRIREKAERDAALYEQRPEREAREVEERCSGRPVDEQVRICEEFSARLEADMKRHEARAREIEKARKAAEIDCLSLRRLRPHSPPSRKRGEEFTRKNNSRPLPIVDFLLKNGSGGFSAMPCHPLKTV